MKFLRCFLGVLFLSLGSAPFLWADSVPYTQFSFDPGDNLNKNPALASSRQLQAVVVTPASSDMADFSFLNHGNAPVYFTLSDKGKEIGRTDYLQAEKGAHLKIPASNYAGRKIKIGCWSICYPAGAKTNIWWHDNGAFNIVIPPADEELQVSVDCRFNYPP